MAKAGAKGKSGNGKGKGKGGKAQPGAPLIQLTLDQKLDILGLVLVGVAAVTILSFLSPSQGDLTGAWLKFLRDAFGFGVFIVPIVLGSTGLWLLLRKFERTPRPKTAQVIGFVLVFLVALATLSWADPSLGAHESWGGSIGGSLSKMVAGAVGDFGGVVVLIVWWLLAVVFLFDISPSEMAAWLAGTAQSLRWTRGQPDRKLVINQPARSNGRPAASAAQEAQLQPTKVIGGLNDTSVGPAPATPARPSVTRVAPPEPKVAVPQPPPPAAPALSGVEGPALSGVEGSPGLHFPHVIGGPQAWELPDINSVFRSGSEALVSEDDIRVKAHLIEETLHSFGVEGSVIEVNRGPVITQFGVEPGFIKRGDKQTKVKVSKISSLADDLALALAARSIRIEAPVPGKNIVGIEVPNSEIALVSLRDVIDSEEFQQINSPLRFALGQNVSGQPIAADLGMMPHLLIAGTTGSGKSVCVNAIICCLLAFNSPADLKFIMVDPKRVELTAYNGIPHLISPVVVDLERVISVLKWVTNEMDERYHKFARAGARNIADFNARIAAERGEEKLPYVLLVIDELADLMMLSPEETEKTICRLAQMARATGIHLIISTQRPSVDVVTGLIKANFPARISFAVASGTDSRVILDTAGAERLLGRGDMLFISPDSGVPQRVQGCFVSDEEVHNLVRYWKGTRGANSGAAPLDTLPIYQPPLWDGLDIEEDEALKNVPEDDLLDRAIEVVRLQRRASISLLQRRLRIGYTRAARLIDLMQDKGIVSPAEEGSRWREVLLDQP